MTIGSIDSETGKQRSKAEIALEAAFIGTWEYRPLGPELILDSMAMQLLRISKESVGTSDNLLQELSAKIDQSEVQKIRTTIRYLLENPNEPSKAIEFRIRDSVGTRTLMATGCALKDGKSDMILGTISDITEAKSAERRVFESEERFRTLADTIPQIVFMTNAQGEINYANRRWFEYTGQKESQPLSNRHAFTCVFQEDQALLSATWAKSMESTRPMEVELRLLSANQTERWFIVRALPVLDGAGKVIHWFGTCTDIDAQTRAKTAAERSDHMKSSFLANMSHEIRTPLAAILGFTELLGESALSCKERETFVQIIARNGKSLSRIVDDILDLSKVEAGVLSLERKNISPRNLIEDTVAMFSELARGKNITLQCQIDPQLPDLIESDPVRIQQIISNLISNAIKFTDSGGVFINVSSDHDELIVNVRDTGVGICAHQIERLFKPFVQLNESSKERYGGTGLGLHLSRKLATALGGSLEIEDSALGHGTSFEFRLPGLKLTVPTRLKPNAETRGDARAQRELNQPTLENIRALLVDDSPDNLLLIRRILERAGLKVVAAQCGLEAIQMVLENAFDIIFMDLQMPDLDGFETVERIRKSGIKTPVIALSAHVSDDVRKRSQSAGCNDFMSKPIDSKTLLSMMTRVLGLFSADTNSQPHQLI